MTIVIPILSLDWHYKGCRLVIHDKYMVQVFGIHRQ